MGSREGFLRTGKITECSYALETTHGERKYDAAGEGRTAGVMPSRREGDGTQSTGDRWTGLRITDGLSRARGGQAPVQVVGRCGVGAGGSSRLMPSIFFQRSRKRNCEPRARMEEEVVLEV